MTFPIGPLRKLSVGRCYKGALTLRVVAFSNRAQLPTNIPSRLNALCSFAPVSVFPLHFLSSSSFPHFWHFCLLRWLEHTCRRLPRAPTWLVMSPSRSDLPRCGCLSEVSRPEWVFFVSGGNCGRRLWGKEFFFLNFLCTSVLHVEIGLANLTCARLCTENATSRE